MSKKKNKSTKTVNVDAVKKEVQKMVKEYDSKPQRNEFTPAGYGEAAPGSIKRESPLEQDMGTSKYRQMIHDHNSKNKHILDRLPFTFPKKKVVRSHRNVVLECPDCDNLVFGSEFTVGAICSGCNRYVSLDNPDAVEMGYDPESVIGFRGTLSEKLELRDRKKQED